MADELDVDDLKAWMYEKAKLQCSPLVEFKIHYYLAKTLMIFCQRRTYFPEKSVLWPINLALYAKYGKWAFICTPEP